MRVRCSLWVSRSCAAAGCCWASGGSTRRCASSAPTAGAPGDGAAVAPRPSLTPSHCQVPSPAARPTADHPLDPTPGPTPGTGESHLELPPHPRRTPRPRHQGRSLHRLADPQGRRNRPGPRTHHDDLVGLPVLPGRRTANFANAIASGKSPIVTRLTGRSNIRANRNAAQSGAPRPGTLGSGLSWEEFPFASTREVGAGATLSLIPLTENSAHGLTSLWPFLRDNGVKSGDQYYVRGQ
ncbi:NucA/NucB deoxyribonuclease domain-containing protein [Saccharothrix sp. NRRL B-16314]|uniref:NucA/NucB deoxyribonuclease domain-containing protein n=1 Tax=Saccharothrix sp. NRRL B-16314 TaxID=1463825 RepID=UPI003FA6F992